MSRFLRREDYTYHRRTQIISYAAAIGFTENVASGPQVPRANAPDELHARIKLARFPPRKWFAATGERVPI
jgi:hypothetical protein